jgi:hypothetical protein
LGPLVPRVRLGSVMLMDHAFSHGGLTVALRH